MDRGGVEQRRRGGPWASQIEGREVTGSSIRVRRLPIRLQSGWNPRPEKEQHSGLRRACRDGGTPQAVVSGLLGLVFIPEIVQSTEYNRAAVSDNKIRSLESCPSLLKDVIAFSSLDACSTAKSAWRQTRPQTCKYCKHCVSTRQTAGERGGERQ